MDLEGVKIKPAEGTLAVKFLDEDDDDRESSPNLPAAEPTEPLDYEGCLAIVMAIGPKVTVAKVGDTVVTSEWARNGMKLGGLRLVQQYEVKATLVIPKS
jgi:hypothetical protein